VVLAADSRLVLDVEYASAEPGARLIVYPRKQPDDDPNNRNQLFDWDDGLLRSRLDHKLVVAACEQLGEQQGCVLTVQLENGQPHQQWKIL